MVEWWHRVQLLHAIVPKCRPAICTELLSTEVQELQEIQLYYIIKDRSGCEVIYWYDKLMQLATQGK